MKPYKIIEKIVINTQHNVVFHGECLLSARFSTQEMIRVAFECPWGDLQDGIGFKARPHTPKTIDIGVARNRQELEENSPKTSKHINIICVYTAKLPVICHLGSGLGSHCGDCLTGALKVVHD